MKGGRMKYQRLLLLVLMILFAFSTIIESSFGLRIEPCFHEELGEAALERLLADCAADPNCAADYPDLRQKLDQVIYRLKQGPVSVPIINPITGGPETVTFTHNNFIHGLRSMLYNTPTSRWIPAFIHWATEGHFAPIFEYTADYLYWDNKELMDGMFLCVTCTEGTPYINYAEARAQAEGTLMGTYRLEQQVNACELWIRGDHPADFRTLNTMGISTLIVSGEINPTTPPEYGEELANYLPYSLHVIIPNEGHAFGQVWKDCLDDVVATRIQTQIITQPVLNRRKDRNLSRTS